MQLKQNHISTIVLIASAVLTYSVVIFFDGTSDSGDSIVHYFFARYTFKYPEFFLHHWAKPVYVLLASPFAQLGFIGIKLFNATVAVATAFITYKVSLKLNQNNAYLSVLFLFLSTMYLVIINSGLTEPLFALFLIVSIYMVLCEKINTAAVLISFLPFVRPEGLLIIPVFAMFMLVKKYYRPLILLLVGHIFYSIVGYFHYHNILWVFTENPNAQLGYYGHGGWIDFVGKLLYILGVPIYGLFAIGIVYIFICLFFYRNENKKKDHYYEQLILIYGSFFIVFIAHTIFWRFAWFKSMGLNRVMIAVIPAISIIALDGFNFLLSLFKNERIKFFLKCLVITYAVIFPFTSNHSAVKWKDFKLSTDEVLIDDLSKIIRENFKENKIYCSHPYLCLTLDIDFFDKNKIEGIEKIYAGDSLPDKSLIVWDSWFSVVECGVSLDQLRNDKRFNEVKSFKRENWQFVIFLKKI